MMLREHDKTFVGIARAADLALIVGSYAAGAAFCERLKGVKPMAWVPGWGGPHSTASADENALLFLVSVVAWVAVSQWRATYSIHRAEGRWSILWRHIISLVLWVLLVGFCVFILKLELISREFALTFLLLSMLLLTARQTCTYFVLKMLRAKGFNLRSVAIVGDPEGVARFSEIVEGQATTGYRILQPWMSRDGGSTDRPEADFDEVFVVTTSGSATRDHLVLDLLKQGKRVHFVPGMFDASLFRHDFNDFDGIPVLSLGGYELSRLQTGAKRLLDIVGALLLLLLFGPLMAIVALLIRTSSPGRPVFSQERLGEGGHPFRIYKFRTMYQDAEKALRSDPVLFNKYVENNYKLPKGEDPRITPLGNFLRATSIDELPQLFNVLKGDMSLVGPRPIVPPEIDKYGEYGTLFTSVKPGLTGKWQIQGRSDVEDYSRRAVLDVEYIRDRSLKTDVDILFKTIPAVLTRKGAY
jgi:exopolysaccharide biosynthesis polyprenyl glycosylphosphotransferase